LSRCASGSTINSGGILKTFGLVIGACGRGRIGQRARGLAEERPEVDRIVSAMAAVRDSVTE
jgi:hypothetical protein